MKGLALRQGHRNDISIGKTNDLKGTDQHIVGAGALIKSNAYTLEVTEIMNGRILMNQDCFALEIGILFPGHTHEKVTCSLRKNTGRTTTAAKIDLTLAQGRKQCGSRRE